MILNYLGEFWQTALHLKNFSLWEYFVAIDFIFWFDIFFLKLHFLNPHCIQYCQQSHAHICKHGFPHGGQATCNVKTHQAFKIKFQTINLLAIKISLNS